MPIARKKPPAALGASPASSDAMRSLLLVGSAALIALTSGCAAFDPPRIALKHAAPQAATQGANPSERPPVVGTGTIIRENPWQSTATPQLGSQKAKQSSRGAVTRSAPSKSGAVRLAHPPDEATMAESQEVARQARDEVETSLP